jgi:hypothetical protein
VSVRRREAISEGQLSLAALSSSFHCANEDGALDRLDLIGILQHIVMTVGYTVMERKAPLCVKTGPCKFLSLSLVGL